MTFSRSTASVSTPLTRMLVLKPSYMLCSSRTMPSPTPCLRSTAHKKECLKLLNAPLMSRVTTHMSFLSNSVMLIASRTSPSEPYIVLEQPGCTCFDLVDQRTEAPQHLRRLCLAREPFRTRV